MAFSFLQTPHFGFRPIETARIPVELRITTVQSDDCETAHLSRRPMRISARSLDAFTTARAIKTTTCLKMPRLFLCKTRSRALCVPRCSYCSEPSDFFCSWLAQMSPTCNSRKRRQDSASLQYEAR